MKLPIKKVWFDQIVNLKKPVEFRDAHITFVCEETGEMAYATVKGIYLSSRASTEDSLKGISKGEFKNMFSDDRQMAFVLGNIRKLGFADRVKKRFGITIRGKELVCQKCGEVDDVVENDERIECLTCGDRVDK